MNPPASTDAASADDLRAELQRILGPEGLLVQPADTEPFCRDWRGRFHGQALAVARPASPQQVAELLRWSTRRRVPVVVQGGNTGLVGGATPDASGTALLLSTRRLDRVRSLDPVNDTLTVEAGCPLQRAQEAAQAQGRLFPLSLASEGSCTVGGNLATNAGGTQVLRYGNMRELALGLEVVLADGTIWNGLRGLRKDNTGYDLKQLFIGSEGTLGIITAATLRLFPRPAAKVAALLALPDLAAALALLARARSLAGPSLTAFELMSRECLERVEESGLARGPRFATDHAWLALLEWSDHEDEEQARRRCEALGTAAVEQGEALDAAISRGLRDFEGLWRLRESIPEAQARAGGNVKHDISLPLAAIEEFVPQVTTALQRLSPQLRPLVFGHLGDGNLHFNVGTAPGVDPGLAFGLEAAINDIVFEATLRAGGSISAEHGIGQLRRELLARTKPEIELRLMRELKRVLDPLGLLNPGKLL